MNNDQFRRLLLANSSKTKTDSNGSPSTTRTPGALAGVPIVTNARTAVSLAEAGAPGERVDLALERGRAYAEAGGDCIFVPGASDPADLRRLVAEMGAPVSVLARAGDPSPVEL